MALCTPIHSSPASRWIVSFRLVRSLFLEHRVALALQFGDLRAHQLQTIEHAKYSGVAVRRKWVPERRAQSFQALTPITPEGIVVTHPQGRQHGAYYSLRVSSPVERERSVEDSEPPRRRGDSITRESGVCEEFGYQAARRKACILLVSCRSVTNFVKMELLGVFKRNSGRVWRSVMATTTSSEGGMPGRMVRSQEPERVPDEPGMMSKRRDTGDSPWQMMPAWMKT